MSLSLHLNRLDEWEAARGLEPALRRAVAATVAAAAGPEEGEISITLLPDDEMRALHRRYLGEDRPTDVLSFALGEKELLGDVYVGAETARRQAAEHGVPAARELARLVVHGVLHLLGHDHPEGEERYDSPMWRLQERVVAGLDL